MSEYLTKEEIRKWRSSLERITLEEYAARLGKIIQEEKHDDSLIDSVMLRSLNSMSNDVYSHKTEKIQSLAIKSFNKEKEMRRESLTEVVPIEHKIQENTIEEEAVVVNETNKEEQLQSTNNEAESREIALDAAETTEEQVLYSFNKALTQREQIVFNHFLENKNSIVYAKDLAQILDLPKDYVYKYIKNLRSKLNEEILLNADNGGYLLKI